MKRKGASRRALAPIVIVHGGASMSKFNIAGTEAAARRALDIMASGGSALDAVVEAVVVLEDDPSYNAGTGASLKLDGRPYMDAAVMDSTGLFGAVAAMTDVRNPVLVARKVAGTPHRLLVGEGAVHFARESGFRPHDCIIDRTRKRLEEVRKQVEEGKVPAWAGDWGAYKGRRFNDHVSDSHDTVGAIAMDPKGLFASAASTGGTPYSLPGRVGDSPLIGCGHFVGPEGTVAATGIGERIMDHVLSYAVYDIMVKQGPAKAVSWGMKRLRKDEPLGIIAIGKGGRIGLGTNMEMASTLGHDDNTVSSPLLIEDLAKAKRTVGL